MFKSAVLKLTLVYVAIVMVISVGFSIALYNISSQEIGRGLGRQTGMLRDLPINGNPFIQDLERIRAEQIDESNSHLQTNLIYFNLIILVSSAIISYFLARRTLRPIEEAMEAQNRFTADASHELRTPLTAMRVETEVSLRDKNLKLDEAKTLLKSNLEEISKLEYLSSALLKLSQYQDNSKIEFKPVDLVLAGKEAIEKIEKMADQKEITINGRFQKTQVLGDRPSLVEVFIILLDNAVKYSPKNSQIDFEIKKVDKHIEAKISDQGIGIKASDLPHIFDRFYRADLSRSKEKVDGYGLGLSIAKRIVELHSGTIYAKSKIEKGSQFTLTLKAI